ncbi:uncharacterized protein LOC108622199 [Ceratina calcarata]|uniref:Spliceosome-associated protein CWC27 homolog n=1 Tax=Ceratina calcarata TaxID=156304 RepID=A0AAJ7RXS8_9HYME|nr:uncharacterized protein LOC108622199 [Ceratina calcarata]
MSNIYIQEPPTSGKVMMKTTVGDIDLELWARETPKACRNFIQLCMEGYYDNTIFHRIVKGFIAQGGDPTGTGEGGESIYEQPFKDEFHTRLRFCRRGLLAMANAGKDDNGSQFFFTLGSTPELQNKHTIFGKVTGETVYNMLKLEEALVDENDRPLYPPKILKTEILNNPFLDIEPRVTAKRSEEAKDGSKSKKTGVKNFNLLSFGEEAEEDEEESVILNKQYSGKGKSAHDRLVDPKLSAQTSVEPGGPPSKKKKEDRSSDWESDGEEKTQEELEAARKEKAAMKERIKSKLRDTKRESKKVENFKVDDKDDKEDVEDEAYYLGKDRADERKRKAEEIRKEIRDLKRGVQNEKKAKEFDKKVQQEKEEKKEMKTEIMKEYIETQKKYKEVKSKLPKKGKTREDFTMELLSKFKSKLHNAKETVKDRSPSPPRVNDDKDEDFDPSDESWMVHSLRCEEKAPVLAKDASTKDDDWFEIYDPRNPLNKRRRGENSKDDKKRTDSRQDGARPRDWYPRRSQYKVPLRILRLCLMGIILPAVLVAGPMYLRYRVYSEQLYPVTVSDQRLIDARVSTTWCQSQLIKVNTTFNAYLMNDEPKVDSEVLPVSMTRHLVLEDDMKEYWGFYLLRGSSVTVSTCVRWPGASLTIIRGHKHLHECAFIGDDSSEELEELFEVAKETGLLSVNGTESPSNQPEKMKRVHQGIQFHHKDHDRLLNSTKHMAAHHYSSHELDAKAMKAILSELFVKTLDTKKKQKENPHHHYEGTFVETDNIDKPPTTFEQRDENKQIESKLIKSFEAVLKNVSTSTVTAKLLENYEKLDEGNVSKIVKQNRTSEKTIEEEPTSAEVFRDVLDKINSLGYRGKKILKKLMDEIEKKGPEGENLRRVVNETMNDRTLSDAEKRRRRRDLVLSSPLHSELTEEDEDDDAAIEEDMLHPDGIAEDRGTVNETTLNDRSNSEFWSSFSSSEERLLDCKGLILNLPLTPHRHCTPKHEHEHSTASFANTVTYRVPTNGYYFFVFNSENEIQPNYLRVRFDLLKTVYNTSDSVHACKNSTSECSLPFRIFSNERTVFELPLSGNDSQWNEEYVVVSTCEPRTAVYLLCIISVPLLILIFAFY